MNDRLDDIQARRFRGEFILNRAEDDIAWLIDEVKRLRTENSRLWIWVTPATTHKTREELEALIVPPKTERSMTDELMNEFVKKLRADAVRAHTREEHHCSMCKHGLAENQLP